MKSRLWIAGAILLAASIYPAGSMAYDRLLADYMGDESSGQSYQETQPPADMSSGPAVEGTEQKGEIETGKLPAGEPGDSDWKSGFEAFEPRPQTVEQNGLKYRLGTDDGP